MEKQVSFFLNIYGTEIPVRLEQSGRYRRCSMKVTETGVRITVPRGYSEQKWRSFMETHSQWIYRAYQKNIRQSESIPSLSEGAEIPYKGQFYRFTTSEKDELCFSDGLLHVPAAMISRGEGFLQTQLAAFYMKEAEKLLYKYGEKWHSELAGKIKNLKLKEMKSRWGSCTAGSIALNWRLIMADETIFEYVFVHEICHIEVKSHCNNFWMLVESTLPGAAQYRKKLRKESHLLMNFPFPAVRPATLSVFSVKKTV